MASGISPAQTFCGLKARLSGLRIGRPGHQETPRNVGAPRERLRDLCFLCLISEVLTPLFLFSVSWISRISHFSASDRVAFGFRFPCAAWCELGIRVTNANGGDITLISDSLGWRF